MIVKINDILFCNAAQSFSPSCKRSNTIGITFARETNVVDWVQRKAQLLHHSELSGAIRAYETSRSCALSLACKSARIT